MYSIAPFRRFGLSHVNTVLSFHFLGEGDHIVGGKERLIHASSRVATFVWISFAYAAGQPSIILISPLSVLFPCIRSHAVGHGVGNSSYVDNAQNADMQSNAVVYEKY
eukprot:scaffold33792_cov33-Prasinocladus_malaysianus.AAC.1